MKPARCPNCGADIMVNELKSSGVCDFCNTPFNTDNAIIHLDNPSIYSQSMMNNYCNTMFQPKYNSSNTKKTSNHIKLIKPKPKLNIPLTIFLFLLLIFPGIIYVKSINKKQEKWKKNNKNFK